MANTSLCRIILCCSWVDSALSVSETGGRRSAEHIAGSSFPSFPANDATRHSFFRRESTGQRKSDILQGAIDDLCASWPQQGSKGCVGLLGSAVSSSSNGLQPIRAKLKGALQKGSLNFVAMGDSITAGHDNFYNQSYVPLLESMLQPVLQQLGVHFHVENFAIGNTGEAPYSAGCMGSRLGDKLSQQADIVTWQWELYNDPTCAKAMFVAETYNLPAEPVLLSVSHTVMPLDKLGLPKELKEFQSYSEPLVRDYWSAGKRPYKPSEWFKSDSYINATMLKKFGAFARPLFKGETARAELEAMAKDDSLSEAHKAVGAMNDASFGYYRLQPGMAAQHFDEDAFLWFGSRTMAVNFLWHPGPVMHSLIASQIAHFLLTELKQVVEHGDDYQESVRTKREQKTAGSCGKLAAWCATEYEPSNGQKLSALVLRSQWRIQEDVNEHSYRSFWKGSTPGEANGLDLKNALFGNVKDGPLKLRVDVPRDGLTVAVCEPACGNAGCERHRGWIALGQKTNYESTMNGVAWEGELGDTGELIRGQKRYTDAERKQFAISSDQPANVTDAVFKVDGVAVPRDQLVALQSSLDSFCKDCQLDRVCTVVATELSTGEHELQVDVNPSTFKDPDMHLAISAMLIF